MIPGLFVVGDEVELIDTDNSWPIGSKGIVRTVFEEDGWVGVEFPTAVEGYGHDLDGKCAYGFGRYFPPRYCALVNSVEIPDIEQDELLVLLGF